MAKFTNKDTHLRSGEKVILGTSSDANLFWDGDNSQLRIDTTISGVIPTQDYHLTTKFYVDDTLATLSGSLVLDHGEFNGLEDDDHSQYTFADGSRGFTNTISGVTPTQDYHLSTKGYVDSELALVDGNIIHEHDELTGLLDDDHTQYALVDGTRAFTGVVGGVTPTIGSHLTTKDYVDLLVQGIDWQESIIDFWAPSAGLPVAPATGARYVASDSGNGWTATYVYTYDGTQWVELIPNEGFSIWLESGDGTYVFNGTIWIRFGSTIAHNDSNGIQGGEINEYYHLTSAQLSFLTNVSGVNNASSEHIHDDRYYTETEIDITVSGLEADITTYSDHGNLTGLVDDDHTQYTLADGSRAFTSPVGGIDPTIDSHLTTKLYVDTISGTLQLGIDDILFGYQHDSLGGLEDDDHTQYVRTDGLRGFTNTISGVFPVNGYDLVPKAYVDIGNIDRHGRTSIVNNTSTLVITFDDLGHTNYTVSANIRNIVDIEPSNYMFIIAAKTSSSFTLLLTEDVDSDNYVFCWSIIEETIWDYDLNMLTLVIIDQVDSPVSLVASDCTGFKIFTNNGATSEIVMLLPPGADGYRVNALIASDAGMVFTAYGTETIRYLNSISIPGGSIISTGIGDELQLDWSGTQWVANVLGTSWQLETS